MTDIHIRRSGHVGRITLQRPDALNAMTYNMCQKIDAALKSWADDSSIKCVLIDALGNRAFCAGGGYCRSLCHRKGGDYEYGQTFWAEEYRTNALIAEYPKLPYVALIQGFTMSSGVGISCQVALIGLSGKAVKSPCQNAESGWCLMLGDHISLHRAPGALGAYLGLTSHRMSAADAIHVGFADYFIPEAKWPTLITALEDSGDVSIIKSFNEAHPEVRCKRKKTRSMRSLRHQTYQRLCAA